MPDHPEATRQLFVVERYDDSGTPGPQHPLPALPVPLRLAYAVRVPADDVVLALIEGTDEQSVCAALATLGWRVDRITPAIEIHSEHPGTTPTTTSHA